MKSADAVFMKVMEDQAKVRNAKPNRLFRRATSLVQPPEKKSCMDSILASLGFAPSTATRYSDSGGDRNEASEVSS